MQERFYFGDGVLPLFESGIPLLLERLKQLPDQGKVCAGDAGEGGQPVQILHHQTCCTTASFYTMWTDGGKVLDAAGWGAVCSRRTAVEAAARLACALLTR